MLKKTKCKFFYADVSALRKTDKEAISNSQIEYLKKLDQMYKERCFEEGEPLLNIGIARISESSYVLYFILSHFVFDHRSASRLVFELLNPENEITSDDGIIRRYYWNLANRDKDEAASYWKGLLSGRESISNQNTKPDKAGSYAEEEYVQMLDFAFKQSLEGYCKSNNITPSAVCYAAFGKAISGMLGKEKVIFHSVVSGRNPGIIQSSDIIWMMAKMIPFVYTQGDTPADCQQQIIKSSEHEWMDLEEIKKAADSVKAAEMTYVFDILPDMALKSSKIFNLTSMIVSEDKRPPMLNRQIFVEFSIDEGRLVIRYPKDYSGRREAVGILNNVVENIKGIVC